VITRVPAAMAAPRQPTYTALTRPLPALPPHPKPKPAVVEETPPDEESVPIEIAERPLTRSEAVQQEEEVAALRRSPLGVRTVAIARMFAGTRYRRGGLSSRGMDCSGLVVRVMQMEGLNVPHHAATLYHLGTPIRTTSLQPGDLLFFRGSAHGGISHVAIWVGDNRFIHASSSNRGVTVDTLSGYYAKHFAGARRLKR